LVLFLSRKWKEYERRVTKRPHVIRGESVIKKRKLSNVTISSEPTTSESVDNESISNSQYIYTAEAIHNESVLTEHSYALGTDVLDIVKDDSTNNENKKVLL
jgi:hypothetical protein